MTEFEHAAIVEAIAICDREIASLRSRADDASLRRAQLLGDTAAALAAMLPADEPAEHPEPHP